MYNSNQYIDMMNSLKIIEDVDFENRKDMIKQFDQARNAYIKLTCYQIVQKGLT